MSFVVSDIIDLFIDLFINKSFLVIIHCTIQVLRKMISDHHKV